MRYLASLLAIVLASSSATAGILDASWTAPTTNTDGSQLTDLKEYRVYYLLDPAVPCPGQSFFTVPSSTSTPAVNTTVTYQLTGLVTGSAYNVSVTARDLDGTESACSPMVQAVARAEAAPAVDITLTGLTQGQVVTVNSLNVQATPVNTTATRMDFAILNSAGTVVYSKTENLAPYCLGGDLQTQTCDPVDVTSFPKGPYTLRAVMTYSGGTFTKTLSFSLASGAVPPPGTNLQLNFTP